MSSGNLSNNTTWSQPPAHQGPDHNDHGSKRHHTKLLQVLQNFFSKAAQVVISSRSPPCHLEPTDPWPHRAADADSANTKVNKWFNLHVSSCKRMSKYDLRLWKSCPDLESLPPMIIETFLDLRLFPSDQSVTVNDDHGRVWVIPKLGGKKHEIVLERWLVEFDASDTANDGSDDLPYLYKKSIILIRALYMFAHMMPAFRLQEAISLDSRLTQLHVANKVLNGIQPIRSRGRVGLSKPIAAQHANQPHMVQKHFLPIQTYSGTLKVSVAYRTQADFYVDDADRHDYTGVDIPKDQSDLDRRESSVVKTGTPERVLSPTIRPQVSRVNHVAVPLERTPSNAQMGASPGSKAKPDYPEAQPHPVRPGILPFRSGAHSSSPPTPAGAGVASKADRRISITSNRSTSNASLVALLRKSRNSFVATTGPLNVPITISTSHNLASAHHGLPIPQSVPSSHGSIVHSDDPLSTTPDSISGTPRFSSSFGQRMGRRLSAHSMNRSPLVAASIPDSYDKQMMSSNMGLGESNMILSGVYVDEDISAFVRMIDSSSDLKLATFHTKNDRDSVLSSIPQSTSETLSRFHSLKSKHKQLGDSVSASITMNCAPSLTTGSNNGGLAIATSRRSSKSMHSSPSPLQHGSYEHKFMPSIHSKLRGPASTDASPVTSTARQSSEMDGHSQSPGLARLKSSPAHPSIATTAMHARASPKPSRSHMPGVVGLATTPSIYHGIHDRFYEDVFEDDDDDNDDDADADDLVSPGYDRRTGDYRIGASATNKSTPLAAIVGAKHHLGTAYHMDFDDEDLLFNMSDMNLPKH